MSTNSFTGFNAIQNGTAPDTPFTPAYPAINFTLAGITRPQFNLTDEQINGIWAVYRNWTGCIVQEYIQPGTGRNLTGTNNICWLGNNEAWFFDVSSVVPAADADRIYFCKGVDGPVTKPTGGSSGPGTQNNATKPHIDQMIANYSMNGVFLPSCRYASPSTSGAVEAKHVGLAVWMVALTMLAMVFMTV